MNPAYYNSPPSPFPLDLNKDQHHQLLLSPTPQVSSSSSSFSNPIFFNQAQDQGGCYYMALNHFQNDQEVDKSVSHGGSCDHISLKNESDNEHKFSFWNKESKLEDQSETSSVKWMPSKMRMMKKMISSEQTSHVEPLNSMHKFEDHKQSTAPSKADDTRNNSFNNNNNNATVRVCADCNTTKTPLWRSGPRGPKSLCNACGIRQRKARRAMAAAAAAANGTILAAANPPSMKSKVQHKDKKSSNGYVPKFKKKCKPNTPTRGRKKLCFEDFTISLSKNSAFQRVFPQDEKEAAILLMALSYGLVHG